ncbi:MAG: hypothetical protein AB7O59_17595 [Pirellulales bacterium]
MTATNNRRWFHFTVREGLLFTAAVAFAMGWAREAHLRSGDRVVLDVVEYMEEHNVSEWMMSSVIHPDKVHTYSMVRRVEYDPPEQRATHN